MDDISAFVIIFTLGVSTVICCFFSLRIIFTQTSFRNAFGNICTAQCITEAGMGLCYGFYAAPLCLFAKPEPESVTSINFIIGQINLYCNFGTMLLLLLKSFNRLHAILWPINYRNNISTFKAKIAITLIGILSFICLIPFLHPACSLYFNTTIFIWINLQCRDRYAGYAHQGVLLSVVIGTTIFDGITLIYLILFRKRLQQSTNTNFSRERKFFFQTFIATIFNVIAFLCTYIFVHISSEQILQFLLSTPQWLLFNISNELSFIIFYQLSVRKSQTSTIIVSVTVLRTKQ